MKKNAVCFYFQDNGNNIEHTQLPEFAGKTRRSHVNSFVNCFVLRAFALTHFTQFKFVRRPLTAAEESINSAKQIDAER